MKGYVFDRSNTNVLDLAHHFLSYIIYEEEAIFDRFPDANMREICETLFKEGVVVSADKLEQKALECAEDSIYEVGYEGFGPVCKALGIEDDFQDGTELYCIIMALYARSHPEFRERTLDSIENLTSEFEQENWENWWEGTIEWNDKERDAMKGRMTAHWAKNIFGAGL